MSRSIKPVNREIIESALRELADAEYQQRVWVAGSLTEVSSMNEATAALFNDSGLDEALERNLVTFSPEIDAELRELRGMLRLSLDDQSARGTPAVIVSSDWRDVRHMAAGILGSLTSRT